VSFTAVWQAAGPGPARSQTLAFDVVFSPYGPVQANNVRSPNSPFALGDELVAHDQLFSTTAVPGPTPKQLAVTGGTGTYNNAGGDRTLVEFGNGTGKLTLRLLSLVFRGRGA
jgi:hypothetical protein